MKRLNIPINHLYLPPILSWLTTVALAQSPGGVNGQDVWLKATSQDSAAQVSWHPVLDTSNGGLEIPVSPDGMRQGTVIGAFGLKPNALHPDTLYSIVRSGADGYTLNRNDVFADSDTLFRIATQYRADMPDHSVWGYDRSSAISIGRNWHVAELAAYPRILNPLERRKVETHLALRYGVTLEGSYYGSDGSILWDREGNASYHHRIFGIARDSVGGLAQYHSSSAYEEGVSPYSTGRTLAIRRWGNAAMDDGAHVICGDDGGTPQPTLLSEESLWRISGRTWKFEAEGMDGRNSLVDCSYTQGWASGEDLQRLKASFLILHDGGLGNGNASNATFLQCNEVDTASHTITFRNVPWNAYDGEMEYFTFGVYDGFLLHVTPHESSCSSNNGSLYIETLNDTCSYEYTLYSNTYYWITNGICTTPTTTIGGLASGNYVLLVRPVGSNAPLQSYIIYVGSQCDSSMASYATFYVGNDNFLAAYGVVGALARQMSSNSNQTPQVRAKRNATTTIGDIHTGDAALSVRTVDTTSHLHEATLRTDVPTPVSFAVFDAAGQLIHSHYCNSDDSCSFRFTLPLSGTYVVKALTNTDEFTRKFYTR